MSMESVMRAVEPLADAPGIDWAALDGATVLVTGATGLVGANVVAALAVAGRERCATPPQVLALARNEARAQERFQGLPADAVHIVQGDVSTPLPNLHFDYAVHAAARTDSAGMVEEPLSVIAATVDGTRNVLNAAWRAGARNTVYVSSMEVYGANASDEPLTEHDYGTVDPLSVRSSYPESKRMAENICCSYVSQFDVPVCIARLAQTFGPGVPRGDGRLFAQIVRAAVAGDDIRLATDGASTRMYVAAADAAAALLVLLAKGRPGQAYNVANESTYCSVRELAELAARTLGDGRTQVLANCGSAGKYPPEHHLRLDTSRMRDLGWQPQQSLEDMLRSIVGEV